LREIFTIVLLLCTAIYAKEPTLLKPKNIEFSSITKCINEGSCASIELSMDLVGDRFVDDYFLSNFFFEKMEGKNLHEKSTKIKNEAQLWIEDRAKEIEEHFLKEGFNLNYELIKRVDFISQRYDIATFRYFHYIFSGGAHGLHGNSYIIFDLSKEKVIGLKDVFTSKERLFEKLKEAYLYKYEAYSDWLPKDLDSQKELLLIDNFIFCEDGVEFVYPLYSLAPYSEGEARLKIHYHELEEIMDKRYLIGL
jgi:hypothetical protein